MRWCVYLLRCGDGSLYCGTTNDLARRFAAHCDGKGARYTRGRGPLSVVYVERAADRGAALSREWAIKALDRVEKEALVRSFVADAAGVFGTHGEDQGLTPQAQDR
ncbi:MAG: GIY-YIG nuclease family protein [Deltaproteobacteria bacterium]|nr:GIY-YIG nuclease family protein [Deltaproteobacteria bacterium]